MEFVGYDHPRDVVTMACNSASHSQKFLHWPNKGWCKTCMKSGWSWNTPGSYVWQCKSKHSQIQDHYLWFKLMRGQTAASTCKYYLNKETNTQQLTDRTNSWVEARPTGEEATMWCTLYGKRAVPQPSINLAWLSIPSTFSTGNKDLFLREWFFGDTVH
jgi:hypothetical protein